MPVTIEQQHPAPDNASPPAQPAPEISHVALPTAITSADTPQPPESVPSLLPMDTIFTSSEQIAVASKSHYNNYLASKSISHILLFSNDPLLSFLNSQRTAQLSGHSMQGTQLSGTSARSSGSKGSGSSGLRDWELAWEVLEFVRPIGEGSFGKVRTALASHAAGAGV